MKTVCIHTNKLKREAENISRKVCEILTSKGVKVVSGSFSGSLPSDNSPLKEQNGEDCDALIVIGGDGTILRSAIWAAEYGVPVLGVNLGKVGFLSEVEPADLEQSLDKFIAGDFTIEKRTLLYATSNHSECWALNDIVLFKDQLSRPVEIEIRINSMPIASVNSDGMIISTPTGSTAYAMSAGGPIIAPSVPSMLVIPICPHALSIRPILVSNEDVIELKLAVKNGNSNARIIADGNIIPRTFEYGDTLKVTISDKMLSFIHIGEYNFFELVRKKLY